MTQQQDQDYGSAIDRALPIGCKGFDTQKPAPDAAETVKTGAKQAEPSTEAKPGEDEVRAVFDRVYPRYQPPECNRLRGIEIEILPIIRRERERAEKWSRRAVDLSAEHVEASKEIDRLKARIEEIEKPRVMKPYSEECKPETSGWYWYFSTEYRDVFEPFPAYYDGDDRWSQDDGGYEDLDAATHWLELEATPVLPEGGAR